MERDSSMFAYFEVGVGEIWKWIGTICIDYFLIKCVLMLYLYIVEIYEEN